MYSAVLLMTMTASPAVTVGQGPDYYGRSIPLDSPTWWRMRVAYPDRSVRPTLSSFPYSNLVSPPRRTAARYASGYTPSGSGMHTTAYFSPDASRVVPVSTSPPQRDPLEGPAAATLVVRLPAGASLTINGVATISRGSVRRFVSPPLDPGKSYQYVLWAEVVRDGQRLTVTRTVTVWAGRQSEMSLQLPPAGPVRRTTGYTPGRSRMLRGGL